MNIDKDIERCKELIKEEHSNWIGLTNQEAIENVLKELETKRFQLYLSNDEVENLLKELETYKKIEEKIKQKTDYCLEIPGNHCKKYTTGECGKCIIDWARKEVENDKL